ncbi:MAG: TetR/AcrR family transcriptional regulator [Coriobacteriales bacterium]
MGSTGTGTFPRDARSDARSCITSALICLASDRPLSAITITELCAEAGVSRMTFYRNFQSKEEVFEKHLEALVSEYTVISAPLLEAGEKWFSTGHLELAFTFFKEHSEFMESILKCGFTHQLLDAVAGYMLQHWGDGSSQTEYLLTAFAGALCSAYVPWAQGGFKETPLQMAELMCCFYTGIPRKEE